MLIKIGEYDFTECWDGVLYKKLSDFPHISQWELQTIADFIAYEKANGRSCRIEAPESVKDAVSRFIAKKRERIPVSEKITECTACPVFKGCMTDLVCHTSPIENALKIFGSKSLLSPVRARGIPAALLKAESRNAANDPEDYFHYIMFAWGNCQAGDRLVNERRLGRFPEESELGAGFTAGVRFFFRYDRLKDHPDAVFDGVLPLKVKNEVILREWVHAIVIPEAYREICKGRIPGELTDKVHYLDHSGTDIWQWSEKVYRFAKTI